MHLFYNHFTTLHFSNDYFFHHQAFIQLLYLQLCTVVPNCSVLRLELELVPTVRSNSSVVRVLIQSGSRPYDDTTQTQGPNAHAPQT